MTNFDNLLFMPRLPLDDDLDAEVDDDELDDDDPEDDDETDDEEEDDEEDDEDEEPEGWQVRDRIQLRAGGGLTSGIEVLD